MTALFEIGNLSASYGKVQAVRGVSINVDAGEIVTIIGPNGAGKTTLLSAIMGLMNSTGSISFGGEDMTTLDVEARVERGICLVPERRELFGEMTVADNLLLGAYTQRSDSARVRSDFDAVYQRFPRLAERRAQVANTLSGGERQMLALGRALMTRPKVLMLDEPSLGLAPLIVREIFKIISSLRELGVAVFLVEQNARAALETANRGYVLEMGEVTITGPAKDLMHDPRVARTYLGGAA